MHFAKYSLILLSLFLFIPFASAEFVEETIDSADGVQISYRVQGEGEPTLVFVHGWLTNQTFWDAQREFFAQTHKVVTLDLAGHGASGQERQQWSVETFADDVAAVLQALELQNAVLIGHALGGPVTLEAARKFPGQVIGIVGLDTLQDFSLKATVEQRERLLSKLRGDYTTLTTRAIQSMFSQDANPELKEKITQEMLSVPEEIGIHTMGAALSYDLMPAVQTLSIPIRSINSDASPTNVQGNKQHTQSYEVMLVPGSKHLFFIERPDEFNPILATVLQEMMTHTTASEADAETEAEANVAE